MIRLLLNKIRTSLLMKVPSGMAACEFDCRVTDCLNKKFLTCPNRLQTEKEIVLQSAV